MEHGSEVTGPITPVQQAAVRGAVGATRNGVPATGAAGDGVRRPGWGRMSPPLRAGRGAPPRTVRRWLTAFLDGGVAALAGAPIPGRPPKAAAANRAALEAAVDDATALVGLAVRCLELAAVERLPHRADGFRITPGWLRVLLHRERFACGRPGHHLDHLQDPDEVATCEAALQAAGGKGGGGSRPLCVAL